MRIWNLTPHVVHYESGSKQSSLASDGAVRLEQWDDVDEPVGDMTTVRTRYGAVVGLPEGVRSGDVLIVSTLVGDKWLAADRPEGVTVLVPDTGPSCRRDADGRIVAVTRFIRK